MTASLRAVATAAICWPTPVANPQEESAERCMALRCGPGCVHEDAAGMRAATLADSSELGTLQSVLVHRRVQAKVAHKLHWRTESTDVANGGEQVDGNSGVHPPG